MKLGRVIGLYLLKHHRVSLPGFGVIKHDQTGASAIENDEQGQFFAEGSLSFDPDPKAPMEESLLEFISRETGKMKPLARSDMDSYLQFGQELINISKPFHLEGIGVLQRNPKNQLEFLQSSEHIPEDPYKRSSSTSQKRRQPIQAPSKKLLRTLGWTTLGLVLLTGIWLGVRWMAEHSPDTPEITSDTQVLPPPVASNTPDTVMNSTPPPTSEPSLDSFGVVIERPTKQRALKRYADLKEWGHNVRMVTRDSVSFKLYILIHAPLSDSAKHRDSLAIFFNRRVWIETNPDEKP